jgi:hypothetical protein
VLSEGAAVAGMSEAPCASVIARPNVVQCEAAMS